MIKRKNIVNIIKKYAFHNAYCILPSMTRLIHHHRGEEVAEGGQHREAGAGEGGTYHTHLKFTEKYTCREIK